MTLLFAEKKIIYQVQLKLFGSTTRKILGKGVKSPCKEGEKYFRGWLG